MLKLNRRLLLCTIFCLLGVATCLGWYLVGCKKMWPANKFWGDDSASSKTYDQVYYTKLALQIAEDDPGNRFILPRGRMPMYPWLLHYLYDPSLTESQQFDVYKRFNIGLSCFALIGIGILGWRLLGPWIGVTLAVITGSTFFVFKAILVQPEILFYFFYLVLFLLMMRSLKRPGWKLSALLGVATGITFFLKGSCLPLIFLFFLLSAIQALLACWKFRETTEKTTKTKLSQSFAPLATFVGCLALVIGPFCIRTKLYYGSFLYDPNSRIFFWAESQEELLALQDLDLAERKPTLSSHTISRSGVKEFLASSWLPEKKRRNALLKEVREKGEVILEGKWDVLPSAHKWFKTHSLEDGLNRIWNGLFDQEIGMIPRNASHRNGYFFYVIAFACAALLGCLGVAVSKPRELVGTIRCNVLPLSLAVFSILGNFILYAWWAQVSSRNRFFLTQLLPLMFFLGMVIRWTSARLDWKDLKLRFSSVRLPAKRGGVQIHRPLTCLLMLVLLVPLYSDLERLGTLDKPFYKHKPERSRADANLVQ